MSIEPATSVAGATAGRKRFCLEFEKPLARIEEEIEHLEARQADSGRDYSIDIQEMRARLSSLTKQTFSRLTPWETVFVARHPDRPILPDYLRLMVRDFCELRGDRGFRDDPAMVTGFGRIAGQKCMIVGHNQGKETKGKVACNFGCAHPEGYRKALLKMKLAEKYALPIVCLIDTKGAYPGVGAEERGIAQAIAKNLFEMSRLRTPIICVVIGEGGSGGALGIGVGDRIAMLEHAFYSVISPEGCAAILWKTGDMARRAAESLCLTSKELKRLNIVDQVIPEPLGGAHRDPQEAASLLERYLSQNMRDLKRLKIETVLARRQERLRNLGAFFESAATAKGRSKRKSESGVRDAARGTNKRTVPARSASLKS